MSHEFSSQITNGLEWAYLSPVEILLMVFYGADALSTNKISRQRHELQKRRFEDEHLGHEMMSSCLNYF
jgi:hypothetical protein